MEIRRTYSNEFVVYRINDHSDRNSHHIDMDDNYDVHIHI